MKRGILTLILAAALLPLTAMAQILSVTPAFPSQNDTVTIIYDATEGNGALTGVVPVYAHAGLIQPKYITYGLETRTGKLGYGRRFSVDDEFG